MAGSGDVRVRLSAEGMNEIIAAFQRIQAEAKRSAKETESAFAQVGEHITEQFKDLGKNLIGTFAVLTSFDAFKEFFKTVLEGAEALERLHGQTGLSTDAIQAFGAAAKRSGLDTESANQALARFTAATGKAEAGSAKSAAAFSDLGIRVRDFVKLDPDQRFQEVTQALARIQDPARRAADELALFGKAGTQLDQALRSLGEQGFGPFLDRMKQLGTYLDSDTIEAMSRAQHAFQALGGEVRGLAIQLISGLVPGLQKSVDEIVRASTSASGASGFKEFGETVGNGVKQAINWLIDCGKQFAALVAVGTLAADALGKSFASLGKGSLKGIEDAIAVFKAQYAQLKADVLKEREDRNARVESDKPEAKENDGGEPPPPKPPDPALARARLALLEQRLDNELKLYQAHAALVSQQDKEAYDTGAINLTEYFARRAAIINANTNEEIAIAKQKRAAIAATPVDINDAAGEIKQRTELLKIDGEINELEQKRTQQLAANTNEAGSAQRKLYEDTLKVEEQLLTLEGKKTDAARLKLGLDIADLDAKLRSAGVSDPERASADAKTASQGNAQIDFNDVSQKAQSQLSQLESQTKAINDQVKSGEIFSITAAQQVLALDRDRLPALQALAEQMVELAKQTGNAEDIAKAEAFKEKINELAAATNEYGQVMAEVRKATEDALGSGISKLLTDLESHTKSVSTAFRDMAQSMEKDLLSMANKVIENQILKAIFGGELPGFGGSGEGAGGPSITNLLGGLTSRPKAAPTVPALAPGDLPAPDIELAKDASTVSGLASTKGGAPGSALAAGLGTSFSTGATTVSTALDTSFTTGASTLSTAITAALASGPGTAGAAPGLLTSSVTGGDDVPPLTTLSSGGYTGDGGKQQPAGIVHAGEFVHRQEVVSQPGALSFLHAFNRVGMAALKGGYAAGGYVGRTWARVKGYATGGLVTSSADASLPSASGSSPSGAGTAADTLNKSFSTGGDYVGASISGSGAQAAQQMGTAIAAGGTQAAGQLTEAMEAAQSIASVGGSTQPGTGLSDGLPNNYSKTPAGFDSALRLAYTIGPGLAKGLVGGSGGAPSTPDPNAALASQGVNVGELSAPDTSAFTVSGLASTSGNPNAGFDVPDPNAGLLNSTTITGYASGGFVAPPVYGQRKADSESLRTFEAPSESQIKHAHIERGFFGGYARGGYTGPGGKQQPAGIVHAGEFVHRQEVVNQPGARQFLEAFNQHGMKVIQGYAAGGVVGKAKVATIAKLQSMSIRGRGYADGGMVVASPMQLSGMADPRLANLQMATPSSQSPGSGRPIQHDHRHTFTQDMVNQRVSDVFERYVADQYAKR